MAAVAAAGDQRLDAELDEHPRRQREVGAVGLPDGDVDAPLELGQLLAQRLGRQLAAVGQPGERRRRTPGRPRRHRRRRPHRLRRPWPAGTGSGPRPGARAPPRSRQQVAREDEDGAAHGQLLDQDALARRSRGRRRPRSGRRPGRAGRGRRSPARWRAAPSSPRSRRRGRRTARPGTIPWRVARRARRSSSPTCRTAPHAGHPAGGGRQPSAVAGARLPWRDEGGRGGWRVLVLLAACSTPSDSEPAPQPSPSRSTSSSAPPPSPTTEEPDPPTTEPLVIAVHVRRPPADLSQRQAGLLLDGGVTRWSQLGLPGGRLTLTRKASALRTLAPDTVAVVPASKVGPEVRVLSVEGVHPLRDPDDYPIRAAGPDPGRVTTLDGGRRHHARPTGRRAGRGGGRPVVPAPADAAPPPLRRHHRRQPREHAVHGRVPHPGRRLVRGRSRRSQRAAGRGLRRARTWPTTTPATSASNR